MKKNIILLLLSILFFLPYKVNAEEYFWCSLDNFNKIQKLASNITTSYTYEETIEDNKGNAVFTVKVSNLNDKFRLINMNTGENYPSMNGELTINNVEPNTKLTLRVIASGYACDDYIMTIYVTTPPYNPYYMDKVCNKRTDYKLCGKWVNVNTTYEEFVKIVTKYPKTTTTEEKKTKPISFDEMVVQVLLFLYKYRLQILVPIIVITTIGIIILKIGEKKDEFDFKLK